MTVPAFWLIVFGAAFVVQIVYWVLLHAGFRRAQRGSGDAPEASLPPVSVVVAVRNEATNLPTLLAALTRQTHPHYEIILVDDASTDATPEIVRAWQHTHVGRWPTRISARFLMD